MGLLADAYTRAVAPIVAGSITGEVPANSNSAAATAIQISAGRAAMKAALTDLKVAVDATSADLAARIALIP